MSEQSNSQPEPHPKGPSPYRLEADQRLREAAELLRPSLPAEARPDPDHLAAAERLEQRLRPHLAGSGDSLTAIGMEQYRKAISELRQDASSQSAADPESESQSESTAA